MSVHKKSSKKAASSAKFVNDASSIDDIGLPRAVGLVNIAFVEKHIAGLQNLVQGFRRALLLSEHGGEKDKEAEVAEDAEISDARDVDAEIDAADIKGKGKAVDQGEEADAEADGDSDNDAGMEIARRRSSRIGDSSGSKKN